ncbi:hypothetical protein [Kitasatospora sp. NPDC088783]|uniref:hypothetical protein n=1 Tax=Kitasatospora sp. NPDC088783 TaxID=3364077 RepID=UPI003805316E
MPSRNPNALLYQSVRGYLARRGFPLSQMSTGRRSGQRWTEGVTVRTTWLSGVIVDFHENHAHRGDGSHRREQIAKVRAALEKHYVVTDHGGFGELSVTARLR